MLPIVAGIGPDKELNDRSSSLTKSWQQHHEPLSTLQPRREPPCAVSPYTMLFHDLNRFGMVPVS